MNGDVLETVGRVGVLSAAIGRQRELAPLVAALSAAVDGRGGTCVISGEAGIGKTRLLGELISRASDLGCRVLSGQAGDYDRGLAYSTLKDVLSSAGFSAGELEKLTAVIAGVTGDRAQSSGAAGSELGPVAVPPFVVAAECLRSMAARQPMVVAVDDAHLADEETLRALALAGRKAAALSLLLVFTVRRDSWRPGTSFAASVGRLVDAPPGLVVEVGPLGEQDMAEILHSMLGGPADARLVTHIFSFSRGNPLFGRELLSALVEERFVRQDRGRFYLSGDPVVAAGSRQGALLQRVFHQDADGRELARAMSALRRVHLGQVDLLSELTGLGPDRLQGAFDGLTRAAIITRSSGGWYEFTHPLLAEVLYNDLGPLERRRIHKTVSAHLGRDLRHGRGVAVLEWATHMVEAADPGDAEAVAAAMRAAELTRASAPLSAAGWYQRAADLLTAGSAERPLLLARRAETLWAGSRAEAAVETGRQALAGLDAGPQRAQATATVVNALFSLGRYQEALDLSAGDLDTLEDPAVFLAQQALVCAHLGRGVEAIERRDAALAQVSKSPSPMRLTTYAYVAYADHLVGDCDATRCPRQLMALADTPDGGLTPDLRLSAHATSAYVFVNLGLVTKAEQVLARATALFEQPELLNLGGIGLYAAAACAYQSGDWARALDTVHAGAIDLELDGLKNNLAWVRRIEVAIASAQGHFDEAAALLADPGVALDCALYQWTCDFHRAQIGFWQGDHQTASHQLAQLRSQLTEAALVEPLWRVLALIVDLNLATGDRSAAAEAAEQLGRIASASPRPSIGRAVDLATASLHGDRNAALRALHSAVTDGARLDQAHAHFVLGSLGEDPETHLNQAMALYVRMNALVWARRVSAEAKRVGTRVDRERQNHPPGPAHVQLTATERDLIRLVGEGLSNRQISNVLHYSPKTVEIYLSRLYRKTGVSSRFELTAAAQRHQFDSDL